MSRGSYPAQLSAETPSQRQTPWPQAHRETLQRALLALLQGAKQRRLSPSKQKLRDTGLVKSSSKLHIGSKSSAAALSSDQHTWFPERFTEFFIGKCWMGLMATKMPLKKGWMAAKRPKRFAWQPTGTPDRKMALLHKTDHETYTKSPRLKAW
eukprot:1157214-Pelagomonas_calceolata.AAC.11